MCMTIHDYKVIDHVKSVGHAFHPLFAKVS